MQQTKSPLPPWTLQKLKDTGLIDENGLTGLGELTLHQLAQSKEWFEKIQPRRELELAKRRALKQNVRR